MLLSSQRKYVITLVLLVWIAPAYSVSVSVNENDPPYTLNLPNTGLFCTAIWSNFHASNSNASLFNISQSGWANGDLTFNFSTGQYGSAQVSAWGDFTGLNSCFLCLCPGASISIDVQVNALPVFDSEPVLTTYAPLPYSYEVTATDPYGGNPLTSTALTKPAWLTLTDNGNGKATLSGAPGCGDSKHHPISLEVSDGSAKAKQDFTLDVYPCAASDFNIGGATVSTLNLSWTDNSLDETGYRIYRDNVELTPSPRVPANTTAYTDTGLACSTTYTYQLAATNAIGDSLVVEKTATTAPCPPTNLTSTATPFQINLAWTDNSPDEAGFKILRDHQEFMPSPIVTKNITTYQDLGLTCSTPYFYEVLATNSNGDSTRINKLVTTLPCAPTHLSATATPNQVNLTWTDNSPDEAGFKIFRDGQELTPSPRVNTPNVTTYSDLGLNCGTTYYYEVFATNVFGDSLKTDTTITTLPCAPSNFITTDIAEYDFRFSWTDNSLDETGFKIERDGVLIYTTAANVTNFDNWQLYCDTGYHYVLKATNQRGDSFPVTLDLRTRPCPVSSALPVPLQDGYVAEPKSNYGQTSTNLTIETTGSVAGGILAGTVTNRGLVSNVTLAEGATLTGGQLSGFNTNLGMIDSVTVNQFSQVSGGNYRGNIVNKGTISNAMFAPGSQVTNHGTLENPVILPGMKVTGGKMTGTIISLGSFENVEIPPSATIITQVSAIPPELFKQCNAQTMTILPPSVLSEVSPEQFAQIPVKALSGLTAQNMGTISSAVIQSLDAPRVAVLRVAEFKQMPGDGVAKFLTNLDTTAITLQDAQKLLPQGWKMDALGNLTAPPGSQVAFKAINPSLPAGITLPNMPDLNSSFALHGTGTQPLLPQLNAGADSHFSFTQQPEGIVSSVVAGSIGNPKQEKYAFMIDPKNLFILDAAALRGLQINEQGQYVIVTKDGKQIPITPMTQNPKGLQTVLGENATVDIRPTGEVLLKHKPIKRSRDGEEVYSIGMFDPFIEPAPEDICTPDGICNWDQADASMQPGLRSAKNLRAKAAAKIIYPDGTSQQLYPAVLSPDVLVEEGKKFAGVEKIIFRMDGTFAVTYQGTKILLIPEFDAQMQPIPAGKKFKPSLTLQPNGKLLYQVPYLDQLFSTSLTITEFPTP
jgi:hypothetical protein